MKYTIFILLLLFSFGKSLAQKTINWNFTERKTDSFFLSTQINISEIAHRDTVKYNQSFIPIECAGTVVNTLDIKVIGDTLIRLIHCLDTQRFKMPRDRKLQFFNNSTQPLTLKILNHPLMEHPASEDTQPSIEMNAQNDYNIYYDANTLLSEDAQSRKNILDKYQVDSTNTFLRDLKTNTEQELLRKNGPGSMQAASFDENARIALGVSSLPGVPVTALADGLAKFIVARVKQEMMISFFNGFTKKLNDTSIRDLHRLFKNTHGTLNLIGEGIYNYQTYLPSIRQSMELDYKNLPNSLTELTNDKQSQLSKKLDSTFNARFLMASGLTFYKSIREKKHVGTALANIHPTEFSSHTSPQLITAFQSLQLFSEALRNKEDNENYWVNHEQITKLIGDNKLLTYFLGLVAQKAKLDHIMHSPSRELYAFLNEDIGPQKIHLFDTLINSLKDAISNIDAVRTQWSGDEAEHELQIVSYIDASLEVMKSIKYFKTLFNLGSMDVSNNLISITENISDVFKNVGVKKYSLAALNLRNLFKVLEGSENGNSDFSKTLSFIVSHAQFIAQLAESKTSDEVKAVLESFAAPIGSWRDKRATNFNIALDSYLGPARFINDSKDKTALSTPVGVSFTISGKGVSYSILLSAIDIGPLTAYRFQNDSLGTGKITLREIIAPGIIASLGIGRKNPLTLNFGWQEYPLLTKVSGTENSYNTKRQPGWPLSINVNIPILTLVNNKSQNK